MMRTDNGANIQNPNPNKHNTSQASDQTACASRSRDLKSPDSDLSSAVAVAVAVERRASNVGREDGKLTTSRPAEDVPDTSLFDLLT
jgi:hypothetical protein